MGTPGVKLWLSVLQKRKASERPHDPPSYTPENKSFGESQLCAVAFHHCRTQLKKQRDAETAASQGWDLREIIYGKSWAWFLALGKQRVTTCTFSITGAGRTQQDVQTHHLLNTSEGPLLKAPPSLEHYQWGGAQHQSIGIIRKLFLSWAEAGSLQALPLLQLLAWNSSLLKVLHTQALRAPPAGSLQAHSGLNPLQPSKGLSWAQCCPALVFPCTFQQSAWVGIGEHKTHPTTTFPH